MKKAIFIFVMLLLFVCAGFDMPEDYEPPKGWHDENGVMVFDTVLTVEGIGPSGNYGDTGKEMYISKYGYRAALNVFDGYHLPYYGAGAATWCSPNCNPYTHRTVIGDHDNEGLGAIKADAPGTLLCIFDKNGNEELYILTEIIDGYVYPEEYGESPHFFTNSGVCLDELTETTDIITVCCDHDAEHGRFGRCFGIWKRTA